jgi:hypothetical protein
MLHAYEIGMLSEEDASRFEIHIIECESCREQVRRFSGGSALLRHDDEFTQIARNAVRKSVQEGGLLKRIVSTLGSRSSWLRKPVLAYVLALLLAYPAYLGLRPDQAVISPSTVIILDDMRSLSMPKFKSEDGATLVVDAIFKRAKGHDRAFMISIVHEEDGKVVYTDDFTFSTANRNAVEIPGGTLAPGKYELRLVDPEGELEFAPREFRVE